MIAILTITMRNHHKFGILLLLLLLICDVHSLTIAKSKEQYIHRIKNSDTLNKTENKLDQASEYPQKSLFQVSSKSEWFPTGINSTYNVERLPVFAFIKGKYKYIVYLVNFFDMMDIVFKQYDR